MNHGLEGLLRFCQRHTDVPCELHRCSVISPLRICPPPSPSGKVCKLSARQLSDHYLISTIKKEINKPIALAFVSSYSVSESTKDNLIDK